MEIIILDVGLKEEISSAIQKLKRWERKKATIIHHDDADGISSAAIIYQALKREGFSISTLCLEKLFPEVVERLHSQRGKIYFYVDIGSAHAKLISRLNKEKNLTIILDHHTAEVSEDPLVFNINPELFGISGGKECSGGSICYLFSKELNKTNLDLSPLAIVASLEIPDELIGINREIADEAIRNNLVEIKGKRYYVKKLKMAANEIFSKLQILGPVGYYQDGPKLGIRACIEGFDEEIIKKINQLEMERKAANKKLLAKIYRERLKTTANCQWFHARDVFKGMGTKVLGSFCSFLSFQRIVNPKKYLVGFMDMSSLIPGFGDLGKKIVKVSARAPKQLQKAIEERKAPPLSYLLPEACRRLGGFGDGHEVAASGIIHEGSEEKFIEIMEGLIKSKSEQKGSKVKKDLKSSLEKGVEEFNRYKSPEATASLIEIEEEGLKVRVSGPFCRTCGFYDYFDDLRFELESSTGVKLEIADVKEEAEESYIVRFVFKKEGGEKWRNWRNILTRG